jgi:hypothetical protein
MIDRLTIAGQDNLFLVPCLETIIVQDALPVDRTQSEDGVQHCGLAHSGLYDKAAPEFREK